MKFFMDALKKNTCLYPCGDDGGTHQIQNKFVPRIKVFIVLHIIQI
jgi:hypothetical protein